MEGEKRFSTAARKQCCIVLKIPPPAFLGGDRCGLFLSVFPSDPPKRVEGRGKENKIEGLRGRQARALKKHRLPPPPPYVHLPKRKVPLNEDLSCECVAYVLAAIRSCRKSGGKDSLPVRVSAQCNADGGRGGGAGCVRSLPTL